MKLQFNLWTRSQPRKEEDQRRTRMMKLFQPSKLSSHLVLVWRKHQSPRLSLMIKTLWELPVSLLNNHLSQRARALPSNPPRNLELSLEWAREKSRTKWRLLIELVSLLNRILWQNNNPMSQHSDLSGPLLLSHLSRTDLPLQPDFQHLRLVRSLFRLLPRF